MKGQEGKKEEEFTTDSHPVTEILLTVTTMTKSEEREREQEKRKKGKGIHRENVRLGLMNHMPDHHLHASVCLCLIIQYVMSFE